MIRCWVSGSRVYHRLVVSSHNLGGCEEKFRQSACGAIDDIDRYFFTDRINPVPFRKTPCKRCFPKGDE